MKRLVLSLLLLLAASFAQADQPLPPTSFTAGGNITSANSACNVGNCIVITLPGTASIISVGVTGTFSATLKPEESQDGGRTWTSAGSDLTTTGTSTYVVAGFTHFRIRASALVSGNAGVNLLVSTAQTGNITSGIGAPSGSCSASQLYVNQSNGNIYSCSGGTWTLSGGGGGTITATGSPASPNVTCWSGATSITNCADLTDSAGTVTLPTVGGLLNISNGSIAAQNSGTTGFAFFSTGTSGLNQIKVGGNTSAIGNFASIGANEPGAKIFVSANSDIQINSTTGNYLLGVASSTSGAWTYVGKTSGSATWGVADVAGTPNRVNVPTATGAATSFLQSDGGSPQQTSWTASTGTGSVVLATSPTLVTPVIGAATGTSLSVSGSLTSTVATGTAPLVVSSTTNVANLNASSLNGATFAAPGAIGGGTPSTATFTTVTANSITSGICAPQFSTTDTLTAAATSPTETFFATKCSIPANTIATGVALRGFIGLDWASTAGPNFTFQVKLCTVSGCGSGTVVALYTSTVNAPSTTGGGTFSSILPFMIQGTAAAGASVAVEQSIGAGVGNNAPLGRNSRATNVTGVPTNGTLFLQFSATFSANTAGNSMTVTQLVFTP